MAVRSATLHYPTLRSFMEDWEKTLQLGALNLPPGVVEGEAAATMKIDLVVPLAGRLGPIEGQLLQQLRDGTTILRVPEWPPPVAAGFQVALAACQDLKDWFVSSGQLAVPDGRLNQEVEALRARVKMLESRPVTVVQAAAGSGGTAPAPQIAYDAEGNAVVERGFRVPDVAHLAPTLSGALGDRSLRDAMMELALQRVTGLRTITYPDGRTRWGFWQKGGPAAWRTEPIAEDEVLGILMFRGNQLTREQLEASLNTMETTGVRQGEALVEAGVITFAQLVLLLQKQTEFCFQRVMREREGRWQFHVLEDLPERFVSPPLRVPSLLFRALRTHVKDMPAEELATTLRPWLDRYVYFVDGAQRVFDEMKLNAEEAGFLKILGSTSYRLRELFAVSNLARSATAGMAWTLADLNLIEFRDDEANARGVQRITRVLEDRTRAVVKGSSFEALDLHWICTSADVEAAWKRLNEEFGPTSYAKWGAENRPQVEKLHESMRQAYEKLKNDRSRREYRAQLMEKIQIETSAEMLAKRGEMAFMKESGREALDSWAKACELIPNNPEYQAGLAKARNLR